MVQKSHIPQATPPPLVLVVEDDAALRDVTVEYLAYSGFSVLPAQDADEAVSLLQTHHSIRAVFSDIQMPGSMNGVELARWIADSLPEVKVLLTSGQVPPMGVRPWPLLAKPYRMAEVERRLRELVPND
jgi:CheY-like chemotaxis protein